MCGSVVDASATECQNCGEPFAPVDDEGFTTAPVETEEVATGEEVVEDEYAEEEPMAPEDELSEESFEGDTEFIEGEEFDEDSEFPDDLEEGELEITEEFEEETTELGDEEAPEPAMVSSEGCPICGSKLFTVESGDLVSCDDCGNVYIKKEELLPPEQNWKLKFWVGLIFIIIGDIGVALGSYVHNVYRWSPLGDLYLGYGWLDQAVGIVGVIIFILGLLLFAWSFKRDRLVTCPSCKVVIRELELLPYEEEEEPEQEAEDIETAVEEIGEIGECPHCGAQVSVFDEVCANCDSPLGQTEEFEVTEELTEEVSEEEPEVEPEGPVDASELDETDIIMESLEYLEEEVQAEEEIPEENDEGLKALREIEEEFGDTEEEATCPECGMLIEPGAPNCPICGADLTGGE
ncbi:MAG: hypothetical protein AYK23_03225 [Candidatus Proteinoplasmatales archaeon SG8-5]|nr:MAG: hypothetical protein AYK23_03225 [Candidatus Proteinoplasmatales archaeon SG8-5]